jgi:hypothetical protein
MLRSYKKVLGKRKPTKFTESGRKSARWRREVEQGRRHKFPYRVTGLLREGTEFFVDESAGSVVAGPYKIEGHDGRVKSGKPVPQLLNEGGSALVRTLSRGRARTISVKYRMLPYRHVPRADGLKQMNKSLSEVPL